MPNPLFSTYRGGENRVTSSLMAVFERIDLALVQELIEAATGTGEELRQSRSRIRLSTSELSPMLGSRPGSLGGSRPRPRGAVMRRRGMTGIRSAPTLSSSRVIHTPACSSSHLTR